jgi:hypothetical protein
MPSPLGQLYVGGPPSTTQNPGGGPINYTQLFGLGSGIPYGSNRGLPGAPIATPGNIQGSNPQAGAGPYGGIPQVPNPFTTQSGAIGGNTQILGPLSTLGTGLNTQIAQNAALPYQLNLPNYGAMTNQSSQNILSLLRGQVPQDVANQIAQMAAERGVATGSIGSPNSEAALLRSLGLTSLGLQQQGESELTGAVGRTPTGQQFNPASFLVSPEQSQEAQYLSNLFAAAPDPTQNALSQLENSLLGYSFGRQQGGYRQPSFNYPIGGSQAAAGPAYAPGQQPLGGVNPPTTGGTAYSSATPPWQAGMPSSTPWSPQPFTFESLTPPGWQTGMPLPGYGGPQWGGGQYGDMGLGYGLPYAQPGGAATQPYSPFQPGDFEAMGFDDTLGYPESMFGAGGTIEPWQSGMPSSTPWSQPPFDTSAGVPPDWQTGMPLPGYYPEDLFGGG